MVTARRSIPLLAELLGRVPNLHEPAELLVAVTAVMDFGDRDRELVSLPGLAKARREAGIVLQPLHPHRLGVDIGVAPVPADFMAGIEVRAVVEKALAGEIMVDAEDVRPGLAACGSWISSLPRCPADLSGASCEKGRSCRREDPGLSHGVVLKKAW
jgi:hypothetical protein